MRAPDGTVDRYYDPQTGQFISVDPDIDETGQAYAYTGDVPVDNTDLLHHTAATPTFAGEADLLRS